MSDQTATWRKSSYSGTGNCVEVKVRPDQVRVRHSNDPITGTLVFSQAEWRAFLAGVKAGEFDADTDTRCPHHTPAGQCLDHQGHLGDHQYPQETA